MVAEIWFFRRKGGQRLDANKRIALERINFYLTVHWSFAGLDAPETTPILALRAAVRHGDLVPIDNCSTNEEADRWSSNNSSLWS